MASSPGSSPFCSDCQTLKLEPPYFSKTWVTVYQWTWLNVSEDLDFHRHCCNNLKSQSQFSATLTHNKAHFTEDHRWINELSQLSAEPSPSPANLFLNTLLSHGQSETIHCVQWIKSMLLHTQAVLIIIELLGTKTCQLNWIPFKQGVSAHKK